MEAKISLVTIWTNNIEEMKRFYSDVLGFSIIVDLGSFIRFENEGVRFAICERKVMYQYSNEYKKTGSGQTFELAFPCSDASDVDASYKQLIAKGAKPVHEPQDMPWDQRTALFADPDGNIHEIFADLK